MHKIMFTHSQLSIRFLSFAMIRNLVFSISIRLGP